MKAPVRWEPAQIELIVRVTDGSFESRLSVPVDSTKQQRDEFAKMWIGAMATCFERSWGDDKGQP